MESDKNSNNNIRNKKEQEQHEMLIDVVMRQTDYDREKANKKLLEHNYNITNIVREFITSDVIQKEEPKPQKSTNQLIYGEIRNMMGNAAANYRRQREMQQYYQAQLQRKMNEKIISNQEEQKK